MSEFKNKSDYSVTVFNDNGFLVKMEYVTNVQRLVSWLDNSRLYSSWTTINVYARRSRRYIGQYKRGHSVPAFPR